jgi:hypothetical protein
MRGGEHTSACMRIAADCWTLRAIRALVPIRRGGDTQRAMSRENLEVVVQLHAEFERTLRSVPRLLAPGFIWDMSTFQGGPDDPEYRGAAGFDRVLCGLGCALGRLAP